MKIKFNFKKLFNKKFWIGFSIVALATIISIVGIVNFKRGDTYQEALEKLTGKKVKEKILYSFALNQCVEIS